MKTIPAQMQEALNHEAIELCYLVRIKAENELVLCFSDHDQEFLFQGQMVMPRLGVEPGLIKASLGADSEAEGWVESDLAISGLSLKLDQVEMLIDAEVEIFWVMPNEPDVFMLLQKLVVSGVEYQDETLKEGAHEGLFRLRLSDLKARLSSLQGRRYHRFCDAAFGDARCGLSPQASAGQSCDKHYKTCKDKFQNQLNFQGFPDLPGEDHVMHYPRAELIMDGGSRGMRS
jgi:hypothetical protein